MKAPLLLAGLFAIQGFAFPTAMLDGRNDISAEDLARITDLLDTVAVQSKKRQVGLDIIDVGFDAKSQKIDTTGKHAYVSA